MERYETIARGYRANRPYEIAVRWEDAPQNIPETIMLAEGSAHSAFGGNFPLSALLDEKWSDFLEICACFWLRDLAREEQARGTPFSADEIRQISQNRPK